MLDGKLHKTTVIKQGSGERIFLAFAGKRHSSPDEEQFPAKSDMKQELFGILLVIAAASIIGIAVWHFFSGSY